jgi:hypothetical protein
MSKITPTQQTQLDTYNSNVAAKRAQWLTAYDSAKLTQGVAVGIQIADPIVSTIYSDYITARNTRNTYLATLRSQGVNI